MCGIIGVVGAEDALEILLSGLERLEYRGYDSAGVAIQQADGALWRCRAADGTRSVAALASRCAAAPPRSATGIGHTRWATHGAPIEGNAHPHVDCAGDIAVIHNGIVENHAALAERLRAAGHAYVSGTDTEVLAHLVEDHRKTGLDLPDAVAACLREVTGAFSIAVVDAATPGVIVAARRVSPLVVGRADGVTYLASDIPAILGHTRDLVAVEDDQLAVLTADGLVLRDLDGAAVEPTVLSVDWDVETAELGGHPDFMTKEIFEQPEAVRATLAARRDADGRFVLDELKLGDAELAAVTRVVLVGCGSSYHAALVGRHAIEGWARLDCDVEIASEFRYRGPVLDAQTLVVGVSQSGETIDTLQALREARRGGARIVAVCNIVDASMAREADAVLYTRAGLEIGVAATKTVLAQIAALELLALRLAQVRGTRTPSELEASFAGLVALPEQVADVLKDAEQIHDVAVGLHGARDFFFIGRHVGFPVALEGALKLKELSYLHAEGYPAGELKHGPIALIEPGTVVVAIVTDDALRDKVLSNVAEVKSRGASVVVVHQEADEEAAALGDWSLKIPAADPLASPVLGIVPLQLLAYHLARLRGLNVDRPRNLAKTVTVE
ncbi:MAG TPA: glutamine--fructose-6-phosphate transaminase (isomerizing) [Acidimicrobiales bacterium]|jgi:glucosamine--fructose-6-phosphate aminotransferase (isomerizing)|nr:glutamine--fructose-6-phosphate transaminase (isomerizing) [Acidimicrobiales bacterium]